MFKHMIWTHPKWEFYFLRVWSRHYFPEDTNIYILYISELSCNIGQMKGWNRLYSCKQQRFSSKCAFLLVIESLFTGRKLFLNISSNFHNSKDIALIMCPCGVRSLLVSYQILLIYVGVISKYTRQDPLHRSQQPTQSGATLPDETLWINRNSSSILLKQLKTIIYGKHKFLVCTLWRSIRLKK